MKRTREPTSSSSRRETLLPVYSINLQPLSPHPYTHCTLAHTHAQKMKKRNSVRKNIFASCDISAFSKSATTNIPFDTCIYSHAGLWEAWGHQKLLREEVTACLSLLLISYLTEREVAQVSCFSFCFTFYLKLITQNLLSLCVCMDEFMLIRCL